MVFRFLHTADLHLDSPLRSLAMRDEALANVVGVASRTAFSRIVDLCLTEGVDALLIAGDLWDGAQASAKTPRFLKQELERLDQAGIRSFIIRGNHDAMSKITGELHPPPLTHVFGKKADTVEFQAGGHHIAVHGLSFAQETAPDGLLRHYPAPVSGAINLGMMHTSLNGSAGHDVYAPCSLADLDGFGYDYWALGHIHVRGEYLGQSTVVMPGIPQGRDIGEAGARTVTLGSYGDDGQLVLEQRSVAPVRFDRMAIDAAPCEDWSALIAELGRAIRNARRNDWPEEHLVLRPFFTGATPLAWRIGRDLDLLAQEARAVAESIGSVWIDKLENTTTGDALQSGLPAELVDLVTRDLPLDAGLQAEAAQLVDDLLRDLPPDLRDLLGDDLQEQASQTDALLRQGAAQVMAHLAAEDRS